jgi:hypothetical protein
MAKAHDRYYFIKEHGTSAFRCLYGRKEYFVGMISSRYLPARRTLCRGLVGIEQFKIPVTWDIG